MIVPAQVKGYQQKCPMEVLQTKFCSNHFVSSSVTSLACMHFLNIAAICLVFAKQLEKDGQFESLLLG